MPLDAPAFTESQIQEALFKAFERKGHGLVVPNCGLFKWESDLLSVTRADYVWEYEIKISKADFKRDAEKPRHKLLTKQHVSSANSTTVPSRFYYVVPAGLLGIADVPAYAGLIYVDRKQAFRRKKGEVSTAFWTWEIRVVKEAPVLSTACVTPRQRAYIARGLMYRYWSTRGVTKWAADDRDVRFDDPAGP